MPSGVGLPAHVEDRYTVSSTDGPLESARKAAAAAHEDGVEAAGTSWSVRLIRGRFTPPGGTVALSLPPENQSRSAPVLRWPDGDCELVEGDTEPVVSLDVGGDVVVAAAQVLHGA